MADATAEGASGHVRTLVGQAWRTDSVGGRCAEGVLTLSAAGRDLALRVEVTSSGLTGVATMAGNAEAVSFVRR